MSKTPAMRRERYHAFDALKAAAMLLGIFYHASLSFVDPPILQWAANDPSRNVAVGLFAWASHGFRMQVFFVMAGFFTALLQSRYSPRAFLRHRAKRLLVPLTVGALTLTPLVFTVFLWGRRAGVRLESLPAAELAALEATSWLERVHPSHLWFLEYLLIFSVGSLAFRLVPLDALHRAFRRLLATPAAPALLAVPTTAMALLSDGWVVSAEVKSFLPGPSIPYYAVFFAFGWLLYASRDGLGLFRRRYGRWLGVGLLLLGTPLLILPGQQAAGASRLGFLIGVQGLSALYAWAMVYGLMGLFLTTFRKPSPVIRYVSDSAYWLYLAHLPIVAALQVELARTPLPGLVKYAVILGITLAILLLTYEGFVRYTFVGVVLNGRRVRREGPKPTDDLALQQAISGGSPL